MKKITPYISKRTYVIFFCCTLLASLSARADNFFPSDMIWPQSSVTLGQTVQYAYIYGVASGHGPFVSPVWSVTHGVVNAVTFSPDYMTSYCTITWTSSGTGVITMSDAVVATQSITVSATCFALSAPTGASALTSTVCSGFHATLSATPAAGSDAIRWYTASSGGSPLGTNTPTLTSTTNYYASTYNTATGCESTTRTGPVTVTVSTPSTSPPYASVLWPVMGAGSTQLSADFPNAASFHWYTVATGGSVLATGSTYTTPELFATTPYYVSQVSSMTGCESPRTAVTVSVTMTTSALSIIRVNPRVPVIEESRLINLGDGQQNTTISYYDGLGRAIQTVAKHSSPQTALDTARYDIVQPYEYDNQGNTSKDYLPYVAGSQSTNPKKDGSYHASYGPEQLSFYSDSSDKVADDASPFSLSSYEHSPFARVLERGSEGADFQPGTGNTTTMTYSFNAGVSGGNQAEEVRKINVDGSSSGYYGANALSKTKRKDQNGHITITYTDQMGRLIAKKQQLNATIKTDTINYLESYYLYDDLGNIRVTLPPLGVTTLKAASWGTPTQAMMDQYFFQYIYDAQDRLTQKKTPGQAWIYYVYDPMGQIVLTQDGNIRANNQWVFSKVDLKGRLIMSGLYKNTSQTTISAMQSFVSGSYSGSGFFGEVRGTTLHGYTNTIFPTVNSDASALTVLAVNYYDSYDFDFNGTRDFKYDSTVAGNDSSLWDARGLATGSKRLVVGTTKWLYAYAFYDKYNRLKQTRTNNNLTATIDSLNSWSPTIDNLVTNIYDFEKVTKTITHHNAGGSNQTDITQRPVYDQKNRILQIYHKIGSATEQLAAQYEYNDLGQVVDKKLHYSTGTSTFLQSIDYRFGINGWLTSINNAALNVDANNDDTDDYFGMELLYNTVDSSLGNTAYHNGNISAVKWKNFADGNTTTGERSYKYTYDKTDQLTAATFQEYGTSAWDQEVNSFNESMTYDENGNILTLLRKQNQRTVTYSEPVTFADSPLTIDSLSYSYTSGAGNQLASVTDGSANTIGFNDGNTSGADYTYDSNGNLTADSNKGIDAISYNLFGKAKEILFHDGHHVKYLYDAAGTKVRMATTVGSTTTTTDYVGGFVYQNDTLNYFGSPEGSVVNNGTSLEYQYAIADNQGNTRVMFTSATPVDSVFTTDFENPTADSPGFTYYEPDIYTNTFMHSGMHAGWLHGDASNEVAIAKTFHVYPGDKVDMNAYIYFNFECCSYSNNFANFTSVLLNAFHLSAPAPGETHTASAAINAMGTLATAGYGDGSTDTTDPRVFLTILVFDKNYNLIDTKYQQINGDVDVWDYYDVNYTAKEESYVYAYISQEDVHFMNCWVDDVTMTYTPSRIVQYNEYYPFGLQTAASWSRPSKTENKNLYDAGSELNKTTGFYDLPYRNYDPSVGRFFQVDGQASRTSDLTPYHYSGNNPVGFNDPSGLHRELPPFYWGPPLDPFAPIGDFWETEGSDGADAVDTDGNGVIDHVEASDAVRNGIITKEDAVELLGDTYTRADLLAPDPPGSDGDNGDPTTTVGDANDIERSNLVASTDKYLGLITDGNAKPDKAQPYIDQYNKNKYTALALNIAAEALLESGVAGGAVGFAREAVFETLPGDENAEMANKILDAATATITAVLAWVPEETALGEIILSATAISIAIQAEALNALNSQYYAPKIQELNPDYYNQNIAIGGQHNSFGGAGSTNDY